MCSQSTEIDVKIERLRELGRQVLDQQTLDGIAELIRELQAKKAALHRG
jgi:hypothetical protein